MIRNRDVSTFGVRTRSAGRKREDCLNVRRPKTSGTWRFLRKDEISGDLVIRVACWFIWIGRIRGIPRQFLGSLEDVGYCLNESFGRRSRPRFATETPRVRRKNEKMGFAGRHPAKARRGINSGRGTKACGPGGVRGLRGSRSGQRRCRFRGRCRRGDPTT